MKRTYMLGTDCETGGLTDEASLLTAYFGFYECVNGKFTKLDELDLKIKPDNNNYNLTAESLEINRINIIEHNKVAVFERIAGQQLYAKLQSWKTTSGDLLIPVGHNVGFDIRKITSRLVSPGSWGNFVSYRVLDTSTIAQFYRLCGKLPDNMSCALGHLAGYYKVNVSGNAHEAKCDVEMTMGVLENLMKIA